MSLNTFNVMNYKGFKIEVSQDLDAENPFEAWDGNMPLCTSNGDDYGDVTEYLRDYLTEGQMRLHKKKLMELVDAEECDLDELNDLLYDFIGESIKNKADFCDMFGIKHYHTTSSGYSQGDCVDLLVCWTPEFERVSGVKYKDVDDKMMKANCDLWGYWAWGDVYGYNIEGVHSCWGFYGEPEESGLLEQAKAEIDSHLERMKRERFNQIKVWIKNRVPMQYRIAL